jgi:hypothetical protein
VATAPRPNSTSPTPSPEPLTEEQIRQCMEWSRHYDQLLWVVTSLLIGANAALIAIGCGVDKFTIQVGIFGIALSMITVVFAASFRAIRRRLRERLELEHPGRYDWLILGGEGWLRQWRLFVLLFAGIQGLWISLFWTKFPQQTCIWYVTSLGSAIFFLSLYVTNRR